MCECLDYDDGTRHTCEACVTELEDTRQELARVTKELAESRRTICISWRDMMTGNEHLSFPAWVKGDTLAEVFAGLLKRCSEAAPEESAERPGLPQPDEWEGAE